MLLNILKKKKKKELNLAHMHVLMHNQHILTFSTDSSLAHVYCVKTGDMSLAHLFMLT